MLPEEVPELCNGLSEEDQHNIDDDGYASLSVQTDAHNIKYVTAKQLNT